MCRSTYCYFQGYYCSSVSSFLPCNLICCLDKKYFFNVCDIFSTYSGVLKSVPTVLELTLLLSPIFLFSTTYQNLFNAIIFLWKIYKYHVNLSHTYISYKKLHNIIPSFRIFQNFCFKIHLRFYFLSSKLFIIIIGISVDLKKSFLIDC